MVQKKYECPECKGKRLELYGDDTHIYIKCAECGATITRIERRQEDKGRAGREQKERNRNEIMIALIFILIVTVVFALMVRFTAENMSKNDIEKATSSAGTEFDAIEAIEYNTPTVTYIALKSQGLNFLFRTLEGTEHASDYKNRIYKLSRRENGDENVLLLIIDNDYEKVKRCAESYKKAVVSILERKNRNEL